MSVQAEYDLDAGLRRLHLPTIRRLYSQLAEMAEKEEWSYRAFLSHLVQEEIAHRAETRIQRATRAARFPFLKTIEDFDFTFQASVKLRALGRFLGPELVSEGRCLVLLGEPGRGKTHLAIAMAFKAIQNGFDARFATAAELLLELNSATSRDAFEERLKRYVDPDVLVIDELGYLAYAEDAANNLYQVTNRRYLANKSILVTSNKEPESWGSVLHDADLAAAIVDRILERGEILRLKGKSYRSR